MCRQTHCRSPSITPISSTTGTDALAPVSVNNPPLNVFLSAAELSHGCIKSDVYDCRFDFSTCPYLLAAMCLLPSAVADFCFCLPMPHLVSLPVGQLVDLCVSQMIFRFVGHTVVDFVGCCLGRHVSSMQYSISPALSHNPKPFFFKKKIVF